jgi:hypothetical protein
MYASGASRALIASAPSVAIEAIGTVAASGPQWSLYGIAGGPSTWVVYGAGGQYAGYFDGNVNVTGSISAASASAQIKSLLIDHRLDPANKLLPTFIGRVFGAKEHLRRRWHCGRHG